MNLENFIMLSKDIPIDLCEKIKKNAINENTWNDTGIGYGEINKNIRNADYSSISCNRQNKLINSYYESMVNLYSKNYKHLSTYKLEPIQLLRYTKGCGYDEHIDFYKNYPRVLTFITSLSYANDYEGGELVFNYIGKTIKLNIGETLIFPSNFLYPHMVREIINGVRYSLVTWAH